MVTGPIKISINYFKPKYLVLKSTPSGAWFRYELHGREPDLQTGSNFENYLVLKLALI
jgi:hypothetical protein